MTNENDAAREARKVAVTDSDAYLATVESLEPSIHPIDASAYYASAAISLKRIADSLEELIKLQTAE